MPVKSLIKPNHYYDSVTLMLVARELAKLPGVLDAAVVMATQANKAILKEAGLLTAEVEAAGANDLAIAVSLDGGTTAEILAEAEKLLQKKGESGDGAQFRPKTILGAVKSHPRANVAAISMAGRYTADEAWEALRLGLHVLLFSDNVSLSDEIDLKQYARDHGLLLMGPGAGTAILNGVALGFANVIPAGPVGQGMETPILPRLNTGIAHKDPAVGMVRAGVLRAPEKCFKDAFEALRENSMFTR